MASASQSLNGDDATQRIYEAANDVEMQDAFPTQSNYLIIDTNVLIDQLDVIKKFSKDLEELAAQVLILIPSVVVSELDGLKRKVDLGWQANRATSWILEKVKEPRSVKVQAIREIPRAPTYASDVIRENDLAIRDCCIFFQQQGGHVVLLSRDKNLCIECVKENIRTISPPGSGRSWSSRELARALWPPDNPILSSFTANDQRYSYKPSRASGSRRIGQTVAPTPEEDDGMDIDDDGGAAPPKEEVLEPLHALDALHLQMIDHFTNVLRDIAARVRSQSGEQTPPPQTLSQHAPGYLRKPCRQWTIDDCLAYLGTKKRLREQSADVRTFWCRRNESRGWRRGQDWTSAQWALSLRALQEVGTQFQDGWLLGSLEVLAPHLEEVFATPMRPTGM
ncbi:hypothetical protein CERSUDRAFT_80438 [Gelatoporia subvermispora B]|uniref:PIN domain-containing protein n=1 Tax=Ceriporiopsis subvermispora (strain B) TaxID=914234 RepID=M2PVI8_CERS8|nr:hypothetical protein CERSUDRAFT_80438 [Gelatoporia subvermispora B]